MLGNVWVVGKVSLHVSRRGWTPLEVVVKDEKKACGKRVSWQQYLVQRLPQLLAPRRLWLLTPRLPWLLTPRAPWLLAPRAEHSTAHEAEVVEIDGPSECFSNGPNQGLVLGGVGQGL